MSLYKHSVSSLILASTELIALNRGYEQQTEVASQLVEIFNEIEDEKQQMKRAIPFSKELHASFSFAIH